MEAILTVPIHVDALFLDTDLAVISATGSFERLPYTDGVRDYNPGCR